MSKNLPLGISQYYNPETNVTEVTWCYAETADIEYFEIEYWDEEERKWKPFDGRSGVIKKK